MEYYYFWGHTGNGEKIGKECLSQWYVAPFIKEGIMYKTCEHWMMYQKAIVFGDKQIAERILGAQSPKEAKYLGRKVRNFDNKLWDEVKEEIVYEGNLLKFSQNNQLKNFILSLGDVTFVEASPYDKIWGIGLSASDPRARNKSEWLGENLLGKALDRVVADLRKLEDYM